MNSTPQPKGYGNTKQREEEFLWTDEEERQSSIVRLDTYLQTHGLKQTRKHPMLKHGNKELP